MNKHDDSFDKWHRNGLCDYKSLGQYCPMPIANITHHQHVETVQTSHGAHHAMRRHGYCRRHWDEETRNKLDFVTEGEFLARLANHENERVVEINRYRHPEGERANSLQAKFSDRLDKRSERHPTHRLYHGIVQTFEQLRQTRTLDELIKNYGFLAINTKWVELGDPRKADRLLGAFR